jgi:ribosomal protein S18 acetylase RimI-like enzyme
MPGSLDLRPMRPADDEFSYAVYASTRAEEMAQVPWSAAQQEDFLRMQFGAQRQYYALQYPDAAYQVIARDGRAVGRLIVDRAGDEILLMDIALLPEARGTGTGTALVRSLQAEAAQAGKPLRLHVEFFNPAQRLYERLGFKIIDSSGIYLELEWRPPANGPAGGL